MSAAPLHPTDPRRRLLLAAGLSALPVFGLGACASFHQVSCTVSSDGSWPEGRAPGRYAFDRLPSQKAASRADEQAELERLAAAALAAAGFRPAEAGQPADVWVQVGARVNRQQRAPWDDPFWPGAWGRHGLRTPFAHPGWRSSFYLGREAYLREVALLLRDRASGEALFETRASHEGATEGGTDLIGALFLAAMQDFPQARPEPHPVTVALGG